jgi:DHA2 family methylenomycin A resistance protein-like MFS transporter
MSEVTARHGGGRVLLALCVSMGVSLTVAASFNYMLTPMLDDLGLTQEQVSVALSIPSVAALLVVFVAGLVGERRGHRTVITWMSVLFVVGAVLVAITTGIVVLVIGLLLAGIAATAVQIVVFGLLSNEFREPGPRARAFGTFGMVSPSIWLLFPVLTGAIVGATSWRLVPIVWALGGGLMLLVARTLMPRPAQVRPVGRLRAPILAGVTVVLSVEALSLAAKVGVASVGFLISAAAALVAVLMLVLMVRRGGQQNFSFRSLRLTRARLLLVVVVVIPLINTVFFMTLAFQYLYGLSVLQTALVMVPAQAGAIAGTKLIAGPLMARIGVTRTATLMFGVLAGAMLLAFLLTPESPLWMPMAYVAVYNVLTVAASITVTSGLMATADAQNSGEVSAYRGSGVALGGALAVVLMNEAVFTLSRLFMNQTFVDSGLDPTEAAQVSEEIQSAATSSNVMSMFSMPLPSGIPVSDVMQESIATGLHVNAVLGGLLSVVCVVLIQWSAQADRARRSDASAA